MRSQLTQYAIRTSSHASRFTFHVSRPTQHAMPYLIEPMTQTDVDEVSAVERECFATPWPSSAYRRELRTPESNRYIVARYIGPQAKRRGHTNGANGWRHALERVLPW